MEKADWIYEVKAAAWALLFSIKEALIMLVTILAMLAVITTGVYVAVLFTLWVFDLTYAVTWLKVFAVLIWVWMLGELIEWFRD